MQMIIIMLILTITVGVAILEIIKNFKKPKSYCDGCGIKNCKLKN